MVVRVVVVRVVVVRVVVVRVVVVRVVVVRVVVVRVVVVHVVVVPVPVVVVVPHGSQYRSRARRIRAAANAAPNPLSMLQTTTPEAQLDSIPARAANPPRLAP